MDRFDCIVLGSGPGGYIAAIRASQLGLKTAIVERESLGGICLNWGCIPTKALLRTSEIFHYMKTAERYGLAGDNLRFDLKKVVKRSRDVAKTLSIGVTGLMKKNEVAVYFGDGALSSRTEVTVVKDGSATTLNAPNIIVATGARARELPFAKTDGRRIWNYRTAMTPPEMPTRLLIVGSGAIGIEFASFYNDMGTDVTVVEMLDRILPVEDTEISAFMSKALTKLGMTLRPSTGVQSLATTDDGVRAEVRAADGTVTVEDFSHVIVAVGILPNTEGIGLEEVGVETDRGHIVIDAQCRTSVENIFAIGDVVGAPWLAHKAMHEGNIAAEAIAGLPTHALDVLTIPGCTYCHPQVASIGLTEAKARAKGFKVRVGRFPFVGNGKAIAIGEVEGFVKTVFDDETGQLLGAHMVGAEVTELIQGYAVGMTLETTEKELIETVFPHPSISETLHESVLLAYGRPLHI